MGNTLNKAHDPHAVDYDGGQLVFFDNVASVTASHALTAVAAVLPLPQDAKVYKVTANCSAISGSPAIQIVAGPGTAGVTQNTAMTTPAAVNTSLFTSPASITNAANTPETIIPTNYDALYAGSFDTVGQNNMLTLRILTGPGDTASNLKVGMLIKIVDPNPTSQPFNPTTC